MHTLSYISHRDKRVQLYELALVGIRWWHLRVAVASWYYSGRKLVFNQRTFPVLRSTYSWWVTAYVGKPSAVGQPARPTYPLILSGSMNE